MVRFILRSLLLSLVGSLAYIVVFHLTFPDEDLRVFIMHKARQQNYDLRIGDLGISGMPALKFEGISIASIDKPKRRRGKDKDAPAETPAAKAPFLNFDEVDIALSPWPLLKIDQKERLIDLDVESKLYGGELNGNIALNQEKRVIDLKGSGIDLAQYRFQSDDMQLGARGLMSLTTDLDLSTKDYQQSSGMVELNIDRFALTKETKVSGFELPVELSFTESMMRFVMSEGRADIETFKLIGDALTAEAEGYIQLNKSMTRSRVNIKVKFKLGEDLALFSALIPSSAKGDDGWFYYQIRGLITSPSFRPDASKGRAGVPKRPATSGRKGRDEAKPKSTLGGRPRPPKAPLNRLDRDQDEDEIAEKKARGAKQSRRAARNASSSMTEEEREQRREERRRLAEERRKRREERLARIRAAREEREGGDELGEIAPPMPEMIQPLGGRHDDDEEEFEEEEDDEEYEQELPDPEVEIIREEMDDEGDEEEDEEEEEDDEEYYDDEE